MERKIGEEFEVKLRVRVVTSESKCDCCVFSNSSICGQIDELGNCDCQTRLDGRNVNFEIVSCDMVSK